MYKKPTEEQILLAVNDGWSREDAERGYAVFEFENTGMFEISRIVLEIERTYSHEQTDVTDDDCAVEAEQSGFCKIIPVDELPENFDKKYFRWIDTPENRAAIQKYCDENQKPDELLEGIKWRIDERTIYIDGEKAIEYIHHLIIDGSGYNITEHRTIHSGRSLTSPDGGIYAKTCDRLYKLLYSNGYGYKENTITDEKEKRTGLIIFKHGKYAKMGRNN